MQAENTLGRRIAVFVLTVLTTVYCVALPCFAQSAVDANGTVNDIVIGRNNMGPYSLSWTDIDASSISVLLDSKTLKNGADYNIDPSKGIIAFDKALLSGVVVRVSYRLIPGKSQANSGNIAVPANINLVDTKDTSLSITGLYTKDNPKKTDAAKTIVGMSGSKSWAGSKISSQFLVSQRNDDSKSGAQSDTWERSTMKFGAETRLGGLVLSGDFMHAGKAFEGSKEFKTDLGKEVQNLNALYTSGRYLQATFKFANSDDTAVNPEGVRNKILDQSVALTPTSATKILFANNSLENANAAGVGKKVDSQSVRIDQAIGAKTNAVASTETVKTLANGKTEEVKTQQVMVSSDVITGMNVKTAIVNKTTQNGSRIFLRDTTLTNAFFLNSKLTTNYIQKSTDGKQDMTVSTALEFLPTSTTSIYMLHKILQMNDSAKTMNSDSIRIAQRFGAKTDATVSMQTTDVVDNGKADLVKANSVALNVSAVPGVDMQIALNQNQSTSKGDNSKLTGTLKIAPVGIPIVVSGTGSQITSDIAGVQTNLKANVAFDPSKIVSIKADVISVQNAPDGGVNSKNDTTKGAVLEVKPFSHTTISTGFRQIQKDSDLQTIRDYKAETSPNKYISLKGSLRDRQIKTGVALDTKNVQVVFNPFASVRLTGELWENPEDAKTGAAQAFNSAGFGLNWQIGSVGVTTNLTSKDEYMDNTQTEEQKIGLEMPLFGSGKFTTGFKRSKLLSSSEMVTRTYSMGYMHSLGGDFSLSLSGYYAESLRDRIMMSDKTDYGAQANFGIKW